MNRDEQEAEADRMGGIVATCYARNQDVSVYVLEGGLDVTIKRADGSMVNVRQFYDDLADEAAERSERTQVHLANGELFALFSLLAPPGTKISGQAVRRMTVPGHKGITLERNGWKRVDGMDLYQKVDVLR